jgi:hypothetical protein
MFIFATYLQDKLRIMEKNIDEQMSLNIIVEAIENAKSRLKDNGFFYLLWGWLVLSASLLEYGLLKFSDTQYHWVGWPVLMTIGGIVSAIYGYRLGKKATVKTHLDTAMIYLWNGFLISILIVLIVGAITHLSWQVINPLVIVFYALGTFVSGGILKFKPLIIGGILAWVIAIIAFLIHSEIQLLLMAAAIVVSYLVPGYMLKNRNSNHV